MPTLVFDYDGTLHDCIRIYAPAFRLAYRRLAERRLVPDRDWREEELTRWLGLSAPVMWATFAPQLPEEERQEASAAIGSEMIRLVRAGDARLYPGAADALAALRSSGAELVFLSNCKRAYLEAHREVFVLDRYFSAFFCAQDWDWLPKGEILASVRDRFPGPMAVIGDRQQDREAAERVGCPFVGCTYGYGTPEELEGAAALARRPEELTGILTKLFA